MSAELEKSLNMSSRVEIVPAILRATLEGIVHDWQAIEPVAQHIQIDVTDGVFAGDGTFRDVRFFKRLTSSQKIELHMMVQRPSEYVDDVIDLMPARCVFHLEAFSGEEHIGDVYGRLRREIPQTELALAINPETPTERLEEYLPFIDYAFFMGYNPGWAGQPVNPNVFPKIAQFHSKYIEIPIAVDGHVGKDTIENFVKAGARILCANSSIFKEGDPRENYEQLKLFAHAVA